VADVSERSGNGAAGGGWVVNGDGLQSDETAAHLAIESKGDTKSALMSVVDTYKQLWAVVKLPAVQWLMVTLFTCKIPFAVTDGATSLKLVEYGVPKEQMAAFAPLLVLLGVLIPIGVGKYTNGPRPLSIFLVGFPLRMLSGLVYVLALMATKAIYSVPDASPPAWFYWLLVSGVVLHEVAMNLMFVAQMSFFAKVSDPSIGGSYMTLLNTIANLGSKWPISVSLSLLDEFTATECRLQTDGAHVDAGLLELSCVTGTNSPDAAAGVVSACVEGGGTCSTVVDGYNVQFVICTVAGFLWLFLMGRRVLGLQVLKDSAWHIQPKGDQSR